MTTETVLKIENLSRSFGSLKAVDNLNLNIIEGELFGFLGPNGAGKTTTISMICGLLKPDNGKILLQEKDLLQDGLLIKKYIGICPQHNLLWKKLTCMEQLVFVGKMYGLSNQVARERSAVLLEDFGLLEKQKSLAGTLSGGMQRRLNLALALIHDPKILILDEPEAGLDPQSRIMVRDYIRAWANEPGRTVILTTHNMDEAERMANRIAIIDNGKLLVVDTPDALKRSIGDGDILEIKLTELHQSIITKLKELFPNMDIQDNTLSIHHKNPISQIPVIDAIIRQHNIQLDEIHLRQNTLEDVFITLTGRRLRE